MDETVIEQPEPRKRTYFFWDYDVSEEDVRRILAGDDRYEQAWVISRLLEAARWDDIWAYISVDDIRQHWDDLTFRAPYFREAWAHALDLWDRAPSVDTDASPAVLADSGLAHRRAVR